MFKEATVADAETNKTPSAEDEMMTHPETGEPCTFDEWTEWVARQWVDHLNTPDD
ncbi:MAG TPA: hypothetical protein VFM88_17345 [Vicinamibacteria bacterium]|nr:hypothetical protein [Vicinamibacteria bacterium]